VLGLFAWLGQREERKGWSSGAGKMSMRKRKGPGLVSNFKGRGAAGSVLVWQLWFVFAKREEGLRLQKGSGQEAAKKTPKTQGARPLLARRKIRFRFLCLP
jgi:hypothetical protein